MSEEYMSRSGAESSGSLRIEPLIGMLSLIGIVTLFYFLSGASASLIDIPGAILVLGGSAAILLLTFNCNELLLTCRLALSTLTTVPVDPLTRISHIKSLSRQARKEGKLILEREASRTSDPFLRMALVAAVDETDVDRFENLVRNEMNSVYLRKMRSVQVLQSLSSFAPAVGFIGTLVGLLRMLSDLDNTGGIGPAMALALVATLYGTIIAHGLCLPLALRIKNHIDDELMLKEITFQGMRGIIADENTVILEQRMHAYIASVISA